MTTVNLGQALALWINIIPPTNTSMLWYDLNLVGGGNRIKYFDQNSTSWELLTSIMASAHRIPLVTIEQTISIPDQGTTDYFIEVVNYKTIGGADGTSIAKISDQTNTSFKVTTVSGYEAGTFIYRILKF